MNAGSIGRLLERLMFGVALAALHVAPAAASQIAEPRMAGAGMPSETELRALRQSGGRCAASVYRNAWSMARTYAIEPAWVAAIIEAESSCQPDARSRAGARGLMQLVPASGAREAYRLAYGRDQSPSDRQLRDPQFNIHLGVAYLAGLQDRFARITSVPARRLLAVAAYNCGANLLDDNLPPAAAQWNEADARAWIAVHTPRQTRRYVAQVQAAAQRHLEALLIASAPPALTLVAAGAP